MNILRILLSRQTQFGICTRPDSCKATAFELFGLKMVVHDYGWSAVIEVVPDFDLHLEGDGHGRHPEP